MQSTISDASIKANVTYQIHETLPQYFHGEVLQRSLASNNSHYGTIKFQVAFNLAVVWMIVFVSLSKGLKSYGKVSLFDFKRRLKTNLHSTVLQSS